MEVIKYLNTHLNSGESCLESLQSLKDEFSIKNSNNPLYPDLFVLNYCQIGSPKTHAYTKECRSLVVEYMNEEHCFRVVSRSFDRFFNLNEVEHTCDISSCVAYEKIDGSLIGVFYYKGEWLYRTKSMIMPEGYINDSDLTWKELIESTINFSYQDLLLRGCTYIFEVVSPENRVVTQYKERGSYLLGIRENATGDYKQVGSLPFKEPKHFKFSDEKDVRDFVESLTDLKEGVVIYDNGVPVLKVKSSAYLVAHRLRGETVINGKRIMDLIFMNEQHEFLSIFPEYESRFYQYIAALRDLKTYTHNFWKKYGHIDDQKEFALKVKDTAVSGLLFNKRKYPEKSFQDCFEMLSDKNKYNLVEKFL